MKKCIDIFKKIIDKKNLKEELNYLFYDKDGFLVGTDSRRMLIFEGLPKIEKSCILDINNRRFVQDKFDFTKMVLNYPACENAIFPDWKRIVLKNKYKTYVIDSDCADVSTCKCASIGAIFQTKYIADLFVPKVYTNIYEIQYEDKKSKFQLVGQMNKFDFKYIVMPIAI